MSAQAFDNPQAHVLSIVRALQSPVHEIQTLLSLLVAPLKSIGLLPASHVSNDACAPSVQTVTSKHIPLFQRALLEHITPSWEAPLIQSQNLMLLEQLFCPVDVPKRDTPATDIVLCAYSTILSMPLTWLSVHLLQRISVEYPMELVFKAIFTGGCTARQESIWEDYVRNLLTVPLRVANASGIAGSAPTILEQAFYVNNICLQFERLITYMSYECINGNTLPAITYLLTKLVNQGALPSTPPTARSQPSFFQTIMSSILGKLQGPDKERYSTMWSTIITNISSRLTLRSILQSIFASLQDGIVLEPQGTAQSQIKINAQILHGVLGTAIPGQARLWECAIGILFNKTWNEDIMRSIVCWISGASYGKVVNDEAVLTLLDAILSIWTSQAHIIHSSLSKHQYLTTLLIVTVSYLPLSSDAVRDQISSPPFLVAVGCYISHTQRSVRLCGMLAAEIFSSLSGKTLVFDTWEGSDDVTKWAQRIRKLVYGQDVDARETYGDDRPTRQPLTCANDELASTITMDPDSDDSLTGYASGAASRSPSPSLSELVELEREPILNIGIGKTSAPVYLSQLVDLLVSHGSGNRDAGAVEAEFFEVALDCAEDLILRRKGFGTELEENAANLVNAFLGLQDNYNLPQFDSKRQAALNALVVSCPYLAAPCLIEEFFKSQYSVAQRFSALEALASGAQELASSARPINEVALSSWSPLIVSSVPQEKGRNVIPTETDESQFKTGVLPGTGRLRNKSFPDNRNISKRQAQVHGPTSFISLSTTYFIFPLVSRFWLFIRDEQAREKRTASHEGRYRHHSAGTGLILNPILLAQLLRTLSVLVHLSRRSSEWLSNVAPGSLEVAVTVGTLPISSMELDEQGLNSTSSNWERKEAAALTAALELALAVLDGCLEIDHGQHLSLQHTALLQSTRDWSVEILFRLNQGLRLEGGSNLQETSLPRTATSVLLDVDNIMSRWQRSMISLP